MSQDSKVITVAVAATVILLALLCAAFIGVSS
jgi:hypothetical protein